MALEALLIQRKIDQKRAILKETEMRIESFKERGKKLEETIEEVRALPDETEEDAEKKREAEAAVDTEIDAYEAEKEKNQTDEESVKELGDEIAGLEDELSKQETEVPDGEPGEEERKVRAMPTIENRSNFFGMTYQERDAFFAREDVKDYLAEVRAHIAEKRALSNVGATIPEVFLGLLRQNIDRYSKLYKHVTVRNISGTGREAIMGGYDEAVWVECCANLNELSLQFFSDEYDCFLIGGYYAICNSVLEDSDVALASEIVTAIGQAIGLAIDKAILYGRNTSANQKMPQGIVSRLAQESEPSGYPADARPWVDLHTTNIVTIPANTEGAALIQAIVLKSAAAKSKYSRGEKVWVMNENTYTKISASTVTTDANGRIVTGITDRMPVVGGVIEVLEFVPDNVIIGGYFDLYMLVERAGQKFATSEHVRFLQNQTVMKGTARYDGHARIAEAFVVIGLEGTTPTADMTFAADVANQGA